MPHVNSPGAVSAALSDLAALQGNGADGGAAAYAGPLADAPAGARAALLELLPLPEVSFRFVFVACAPSERCIRLALVVVDWGGGVLR